MLMGGMGARQSTRTSLISCGKWNNAADSSDVNEIAFNATDRRDVRSGSVETRVLRNSSASMMSDVRADIRLDNTTVSMCPTSWIDLTAGWRLLRFAIALIATIAGVAVGFGKDGTECRDESIAERE